MVVTCTIDFNDNPCGVFLAGQTIMGIVTLEANKPKKVKGVTLEISGFASTSWREKDDNYHGHEDYLATSTQLLSPKADEETIVIAPGIHTYTFMCNTPQDCPSSFEGSYGHLRYLVKITLARPWKFNQTFTKGFTIVKLLDLNVLNTPLNTACSNEIKKTFCCGPCRSEPLRLEMSLPQTGFVPGHCIPVNVLVTNDSNMNVEELQLQLVLNVRFVATFPLTKSQSSRKILTVLKGDPVLRYSKKNFNYSLPVPATPPTCTTLSKLIQLSYEVELVGMVKGAHINPVVKMPVTIGSIPLMDSVIIQQPSSSNNANFQRELMYAVSATSTDSMEVKNVYSSAAPFSPWTENANLSCPTYEEAKFMSRAILNDVNKHEYGPKDFAPMYPVFNILGGTSSPLNEEPKKRPDGTWL